MRDQLLRAIAARLERFTATEDPGLILDPAAADEVSRLMSSTRDPVGDRQVGLLAGLFHWYRYLVAARGDEVDLSTALALLSGVYRTNPDAVPAPLHRFLDAPPPASGEASQWGQLAVVALETAMAYSDERFLETSIIAGRRAVTLGPADPDRPMHLANLCSALRFAFTVTGDLAALNEAVSVGEQAVSAVPQGHPDQTMYLVNLGTIQRERFGATGRVQDLEDAIRCLRRAATAAAASDPFHRPLSRVQLARALRQRSASTGDPGSLDEAITIGRAGLADDGTPAELRPEFEADLGAALAALAERTVDQAVLAAGIGHLRNAVTASRTGESARAGRLSTLAGTLMVQYEWTEDLGVLDEAIATGRAAVAETGEGDRRLSGHLSNLGSALLTRFGRTNQPAFAEEAIRTLRRAVAACPEGHPDRAMFLSALGEALRELAESTGDLTALDEAAECLRDSLAAYPEDHPDRVAALGNLTTVLWGQFERSGELSVLREAVTVGRTAAAVIPDGHRFRTPVLSNLSGALGMWAHRTGDQDARDESVRYLREVVDATPEGHANRAMYLANLSTGLRAVATPRDADLLDEAVDTARKAVAATVADHPREARHLFTLGLALERRAPAESDESARETIRAAAAIRTAPTSTRIEVAVHWAKSALRAGDIDDAVAGFAAALELLPRLAGRHLGRGDSEHWLARYAGLASDAAACALEAGDPARAVTLLEQGRGVLLAQAIDGRSDLTDLREREPELADRFARLTQELDTAETDRHGGSDDRGGSGAPRRRELAAELDRVIDRVRAVPGLERFLLPPKLSQLVAEASAGPVVMINVSATRCDAIALTDGGVRVIPLPLLDATAVRDRAAGFLSAVDTAHDPAAGVVDRHDAGQTVGDVLRWLWDAVAGPVLDSLGFTDAPADGEEWPRVWWAPAGLLSLLPLHAAGHHDSRPRTVLDRVVSSYSPTVRALAYARSRRRGAQPSAPLVVAMSKTPGATDLAGAEREAAMLRSIFPTAQVVSDAEATRDRVLSELAGQQWVHFACHGYSDPVNPSRSRLLIHDHADRPLGVLDVSRLRVADAELAFLSACHTARTATGLADEAIHIATAFQLAGYRQVIGTLWTVDDLLAAEIAEQVYGQLAEGASRAAHAVHRAVREIRDRYPRTPSLWAAHVHVGP
jgi:tetratricopeptide (TPR) repeat protein